MTGEPPKHVDLSVAFHLSSAVEDRIAFIEEQWHIKLPVTLHLLEKFGRLLGQPTRIRPNCMLLLAGSGMGKSYVAEEIIRKNPPFRDKKAGITHRPVLRVETVPMPTVSRLLSAIADAADIPVHSIKANDLFGHLAHQLKATNLQLTIIDEIQLIGHTSQSNALACADLLKWLGNVTRRPVVVMGTPDAKALFSRDRQLDSRFKREEILPWQMGADLQVFVKTLLMQLPMKEPWDDRILTESGLRSILSLTDGITGEIIQCIKSAAVDTLLDGRERLKLEDLISMG